MRTEPSFSAGPEHNSLPDSGEALVSDADAQLLSDYRQRYGLSVDPFADDPHFPFYTGGQRRQVLEQLLHLCQFSNNLLLVTGDYGVGKTRMAQALIDSLDDADDICFVEGQVTSDIDSLLTDIFAQFDLSDSQEFAEFCAKNSEQDGLVVLIVDNAHHLSDTVVSALINILQEHPASRLHLVLFAEPHLLDRLDRVQAPDLVLTDLRLDKFSLGEAVDYLNFRMEMADYLGPEVFVESKVEPWWRQSQGQLLLLHDYAHEKLLASVVAVQPAKAGKSNTLVPHIVATSVLAGGLLFGYFYWGDSSPKPATAPAVSSVAASQSVVTPPITQPAAQAQLAAASSMAVLSAVSASAEPLAASESSASAASVNPEKPQSAATVKQSVVPLAQTNSLASAPAQKPAAIATQAVSSAKKVVLASEPVSVPAPAKSKSVESADAAKSTRGLSAQEKTILAWDASEFTLQLMGLSSEKAARDFIAAQSNKKDLLLFRSVRQGKDWFVVVTGRFASSAKARQAAQLLPEAQLKSTPWPREVGVIQKEIKR